MFCLFCLTTDYYTNLFQNKVPHQNGQDFASLCTVGSSVKKKKKKRKSVKGEANPGIRMATSLREKR